MKEKSNKSGVSRQGKAQLLQAPDVNTLIQASLPARFSYVEIQSRAAATHHQSRWPLLAEAAALGGIDVQPVRKAN